MSRDRLWLAVGAANVLLALILGAAGAHAIAVQHQGTFGTAVSHQMTQGLGLLLMGLAQNRYPERGLWHWAAVVLVVGIIAFCGGIYLKILAGATALGPVVPIGGSLMMLAWVLFLIGALRRG